MRRKGVSRVITCLVVADTCLKLDERLTKCLQSRARKKKAGAVEIQGSLVARWMGP